MPAKDAPAATTPKALIGAVKRLLRPLVRLLISKGMGLPALTEILKQVYVDVALTEFPSQGKKTAPAAEEDIQALYDVWTRYWDSAGGGAAGDSGGWLIGALMPPPGVTMVGPGDPAGDCNGSAFGDGTPGPDGWSDGACAVVVAPLPARDCATALPAKATANISSEIRQSGRKSGPLMVRVFD